MRAFTNTFTNESSIRLLLSTYLSCKTNFMLRAVVEEFLELHARVFCWFMVLQINLFCSLHFLYHYCNEKIFDGLAIHPNPPRIRIPHLTSSSVLKCFKMGPVSVANTSRKANFQNLMEGHVHLCRTFINQLASESVSHYHKRETMTIAEELSWLM